MPLSGEGRRSLRPKARRFAAVAAVLLNGRIGLTRFRSHSPIKSKSSKTWSYPLTSIRIERDFYLRSSHFFRWRLPLRFGSPDRKQRERSWGLSSFHRAWTHCFLTLGATSGSA